MKIRMDELQGGQRTWRSAVSVIAASIALAVVPGAFASVQSTPSVGELKKQLTKVPRAEIAAKVSSLVVAAQGQDRENLAEMVVAAAIDLNPTATTAIVGQVAKMSPDVAALVAAKAAAKQPKQVGAIARAASAAAPSQSLAIVGALCKQSPNDYREIAVSAAEGAPGNDRGVLNAVVGSVPNLKVFLVRATETLTGAGEANPTVPMVVSQMNADLKKVAPALKTTVPTLVAQGVPAAQYAVMPPPPAPPKTGPNPILRPPFTPRKDGNDKIPPMTRDDTVVVNPSGPRNYSSP